MTRRVALVHVITETGLAYSHGLAALAGELVRSAGRSIDLHPWILANHDMADAASRIADMSPDIVLVSATTNQWFRARELASALKARMPQVTLCLGGSHATAAPAAAKCSDYDIVVPGEADEVIADIVNGGSLGVADVRWRCARALSGRRVAQPLDATAMPCIDMYEVDVIRAYPSLMFSRGCPYACTYCLSRRGGVAGAPRWKSPERAIAEIRMLTKYARPPELYFDDDAILKNPRWVESFCELYKMELRLPFYCNTRPETLTPHLAATLAGAGCAGIGIGLESGSERIRRDVLARPVSDASLIQAFAAARGAGLRTWSFNMVGIPGEQVEDVERTIALNEMVGADFVRVSIFTRYPGTPISAGIDGNQGAAYIRQGIDLPQDIRAVYDKWLNQLRGQNRLWLTKEECEWL